MPDPGIAQQLVDNPREALNIEVKSWIDPASKEGQAKIVRCLLAMRNHGGGFMVIGFDDGSLQPSMTNRPVDVRTAFHVDVIQALVSRHASESFEISIHFPVRGGLEYPVLEVPAGIKTPLTSKQDLLDGNGLVLMRKDSVLVRSLNANGVPSTTAAGAKDWSRLVETCFDNREADIGRFLRRHLAGLGHEQIRALREALSETQASEPTSRERLETLLAGGLNRFHEAVSGRALTLPAHGWWEAALVLPGVSSSQPVDLLFLNALLSSNPNLTGWPVWVDSRRFSTEAFQPYLYDDFTWEAFLSRFDEAPGLLDFWRMNARGEFYLYRAYQDDISGTYGPKEPMTRFDFGLPVIRVAEVLAVGLAFAEALGVNAESAPAAFAFRWNALKDRELSAWAHPGRVISPGRRAYRDAVTSFVDVPLDTPRLALNAFVDTVTKPLFEAFGGFRLDPTVTEQLVTDFFKGRA